MATHRSPRPRRAAARLARGLAFRFVATGTAWLSRAAVALMITIGLIATAAATRVVNESDLVVERGEDCESAEQARFHAQTLRRWRGGAGPLALDIREPRAPRSLAPGARPDAPRPSWQRPRRTEPPDDDDDDSLP
ncbi:MAG TPA: hypothetical protein VK034_26930 [Enhygromyxa sp.]|nr:hypothetical protein [Enhygromyxa sp.]